MRAWGFLRYRIACIVSTLAIGLIAGGSARATSVTSYVVIQPIDVCGTAGPSSATGCAPFNTLSKSPNPTTATSTTPIGFVDTTTNINLTRAIWLQAGIDVTFLPIVEYNNSTDQAIEIDCSNGTNPCTGTLTSNHFKALSSGTPGATSGCISNCAVPLAPASANAINMFFVNSLTGGAGVTGTLFGFAWINNNGVAVSKPTFFPSLGHPTFDTLAHELGHNLNLDHATFGNPQPTATPCTGSPLPTPGGCNVMDSGSIRIIPASTGCTAQSTTSSTSTGGALYDLDTGICAGTRAQNYPIADQLILGSTTTAVQQGQALLSGFLNPVPNVKATAGGGICTNCSGVTTAARTTTKASSTNSGILFTITNEGGGRDSEGEFVNNVIIALANGLDIGGNKAVTFVSGPQIIQVNKVNGNNGENPNCNKQVGLAPPSVHCIQIVYQPGAFLPGNTSQFTLNITQNDQPLTDPAQVAGSQFSIELETDQPNTTPGAAPIALFATTGDFVAGEGNAQANSNDPDPAVAAVILNAATFQGTPNQLTGLVTACTPQQDDSGFFCPDQAGGDPTGPD